MATKTIFSLSLLAFLWATPVLAQKDSLEQSLLTKIPIWMNEHHVPCAGVGIIRDGQIAWIKVFGDLDKGLPAPFNTLFNIASQTKPVTALATLELVKAGLWNLDEPLMHYWVDPDIAADSNLKKLTTRLVLSHQSGFPNWRTDNGGTRLRFIFEPGTRFGYSGEGYEYLRRALEHKFHQSLQELMKTYLFIPYGMDNTQYWNAQLDTNRFARWFDGKGSRYMISMETPINAADDLITTVGDYCRFGIAVINGAGLPDTLFSDMVKPEVKVKDNYYRCLGFGRVEGLHDGAYALEHGGSDVGVRTMAIFIPQYKSGIVVMTNADNGLFVTDEVIRLALPEGEQILATMNKGATVHTRIALPDSVIQKYAGVYVQSNGKEIKLEQAGNGIKVSGDGVPTAILYPESSNAFFLEGYDVQMKFPDVNTLAIYENGKQVMQIPRKMSQ
jgi:CubicO group peptidase (beta-lactamase class C family)